MNAARDESHDDTGRLRPHWRRMLGSLLGLGTSVLHARRQELDRAYADEGPAALLATSPASAWRCDPVPFLFTETEFLDVTTRLAQRASVLEAVLADTYGPQTLLAQGILPPALIYANSAYLRPCRTGTPQRYLHLYAADLCRQPDGAWHVLADRTAEPSGLAYALENRRMMARAFPELFRATEIASLRPFLDAWLDSLQRLAPENAGNPGLALLTPGHADPHWFEHVILARELGCALVEDGDLTIRDGKLWVKTLRGLSPLHVLLRRQAGETIDPLELPADAGMGVPGMLCAMRDGTVTVTNHPGAALAQSPGIVAFLPVLSRHLLNQELALPSLETLWLGERVARSRVNAAADDWRIVRAEGGPPIIADLGENPWAYAATARPNPSLAPCLGEGDVVDKRPVVIRLFLMFDGQSWRPLQGGVARVVGADQARQRIAKDVWVLTEEGSDIVGPGNLAVAAMPIRRMPGDLPSRVADNFTWFGRYLERLENAARLTRAMLTRLGRATLMPRDLPELAALSACLAEAGMVSPDLGVSAGVAVLTDELRRGMESETGQMARLTASVQSLADTLRDRLSGDMHAMIAHGVRGLKGARLALAPGVRGRQTAGLGLLADYAGRVLEFSATVSGYAAENMVRGGGHLFLDLGRRIERAQATAQHLALALDQKPDRIEAGLALALELCDSTLTYRFRYLSVLQPAAVLDLVLTDEGNPRSLGFQLTAIRRMLGILGDQHDDALFRMLDAPIDDMRDMVGQLVAAEDQAACAATFPPRLRDILQHIGTVSTAMGRQYFAHLPASATSV
jgi:uncharacterized circularly permuted ATP-grasp superfamily protein/uncharacterized alpha-E superfamily protein